MDAPRLLLLTGTSPDEPGVGGVWIRDILDLYPADRAACFSFAAPGDGRYTGGLGDRHAGCAYPCAYPQSWRPGRLRRGWHAARLAWTRATRERALVERAVAFGRAQRCERIWAIPERPHMFRLARRVAERLGCPLYATIWDPPEALAITHCLDRVAAGVMHRDFDDLLRNTLAYSVMCEGMQARYAPRYTARTVILRHGIEESLWAPPGEGPCADNRLVIGFAGTANGPREWRALLDTLHAADWKLDHRQVVLRTLSHSVCESTPGAACIEHLGYRPLREVIRLLSECDVLYLPYFSEPEWRVSAETSFPTKLTAYLAAGRPVFYHGRRGSAVERFFERYPAGLCCTSREARDVLATLRCLIGQPRLYRLMTVAGRAALQEELSALVFRQRVAELLGLEPAQLTGARAGGATSLRRPLRDSPACPDASPQAAAAPRR